MCEYFNQLLSLGNSMESTTITHAGSVQQKLQQYSDPLDGSFSDPPHVNE